MVEGRWQRRIATLPPLTPAPQFTPMSAPADFPQRPNPAHRPNLANGSCTPLGPTPLPRFAILHLPSSLSCPPPLQHCHGEGMGEPRYYSLVHLLRAIRPTEPGTPPDQATFGFRAPRPRPPPIRPENHPLGRPQQHFPASLSPRAVDPRRNAVAGQRARLLQAGMAQDLRSRRVPGQPLLLRQQIAPPFRHGVQSRLMRKFACSSELGIDIGKW
jgi:hypothetical protein